MVIFSAEITIQNTIQMAGFAMSEICICVRVCVCVYNFFLSTE